MVADPVVSDPSGKEPLAKRSGSFTRNKLLRHIPTEVEAEIAKPVLNQKLEPKLKPLPKASNTTSSVELKKVQPSPSTSKRKTPPFKVRTPIVEDGIVETPPTSDEEGSDIDDDFIRKQIEERVEYKPKSEEPGPIKSNSLPKGLNATTEGFKLDEVEEEIDPELMALDEYLSEGKLRAATGEDNLSNVKHLEIIVNTTNNSLGDIGNKLPNLEELKLNGSTIPSIRDLGTSLKNVKVLWLSRCGIQELDGILALCSLRELYLSYNDIDDISNLSGMDELEILDLEGNNIEDDSQLIYLQDCKKLTCLSLSGNPMMVKLTGSKLKSTVLGTLPQLQYLDDSPLKDDENFRGVSPICKEKGEQSLEDLESEFEMLKKSIKFTKMESLDETLNENPLILTMSNRLFNPTDSNMIRNITVSTPSLDGGRPQSASFFKRPTTAASSVFSSMTKSRAGFRPTTSSQFRPSTARPTTASSNFGRPVTASQEKRMSVIPTTIEPKKDEDDGSSHLTFKTSEVFCGNIAKSLKVKKQEDPIFTSEGSIDNDILAQIQKRKIEAVDEPNEELEEFVNEVYEGVDVERDDAVLFSKGSKLKVKAESYTLQSIPVYDDIFDEPSEPRSRRKR